LTNLEICQLALLCSRLLLLLASRLCGVVQLLLKSVMFGTQYIYLLLLLGQVVLYSRVLVAKKEAS